MIFVAILAFPKLAHAQVVINEVSSASAPEWVELFNNGPEPVSLKGYVMDFGDTNQEKSFCDEDQIDGNSYKLIILSSSSWMANSGDTVSLSSESGLIDSIGYGTDNSSLEEPTSSQSLTRTPDGGQDWILSDSPTQQGESVSFDCPTPTPTFSPTPTPAATSSPTPIPTKSPSPKPTSTKTPTPIPSKTPSPSPTESPSPQPAERSQEETKPTPSPEEQVLGETSEVKGQTSRIHPLAFVFMLIGGIFVVAGFYPFFKRLLSKYNRKNCESRKEENKFSS